MSTEINDALFHALQRYLDDELERQETVLAVALGQGEAARAHDVELLDARTAALATLIRDTVAAEEGRMAIVRQLVDMHGLPEEQQTLTALIQCAPETSRTRLQELQARLRATLNEVRRVVRDNHQLMRRSLRIVNGAMNSLVASVPAQYNARGENAAGARLVPVTLDHRG